MWGYNGNVISFYLVIRNAPLKCYIIPYDIFPCTGNYVIQFV